MDSERSASEPFPAFMCDSISNNQMDSPKAQNNHKSQQKKHENSSQGGFIRDVYKR